MSSGRGRSPCDTGPREQRLSRDRTHHSRQLPSPRMTFPQTAELKINGLEPSPTTHQSRGQRPRHRQLARCSDHRTPPPSGQLHTPVGSGVFRITIRLARPMLACRALELSSSGGQIWPRISARFAAYSSSVICPFTRSCSSSESRADDGAPNIRLRRRGNTPACDDGDDDHCRHDGRDDQQHSQDDEDVPAGESVTHIRSLPAPTTPPTAATGGSSLAEVQPGFGPACREFESPVAPSERRTERALAVTSTG